MALSKIPSAGFQDNVKFRNLIINGDSSIFQRSTSASSLTGSGYHAPDRFRFSKSGFGTWTWSQSTDVPSGQGFAYSQKLDCTTADASPSASSEFKIETRFEGQNVQYLKKGTSSAESLTLSFWVKSSKTGTHIAELQDIDNNRAISLSYTVNTGSTWEKKIITLPPDTTGTLDNDNANSLRLNFWLGAGSNFTSGTLQTTWGTYTIANRAVGQVNLADSTSNEWYITGVQLEAGTSASDFEFLPQPVMKNLCHRYCYVPTNEGSSGDGYVFAWGYCNTSSQGLYFMPLPTLMRSQPTLVLKNTSNALEQGYHNATVTQHNTNVVTRSGTISSDKNLLLVVGSASFNGGQGTHLRFARQDTDETSFVVDAEL